MNFNELTSILETGTIEELTAFCNANNLAIKEGKIVHNSPKEISAQLAFWDKRQLVKKINLNS